MKSAGIFNFQKKEQQIRLVKKLSDEYTAEATLEPQAPKSYSSAF